MPLPELTAVNRCPLLCGRDSDEARGYKHCGRDLVQGALQSARFEIRTPLGTAREIVQLLAAEPSTIRACDATRGGRCSFFSDGTNAIASPATAVTPPKAGGQWLRPRDAVGLVANGS
jgi:hypothetical protein